MPSISSPRPVITATTSPDVASSARAAASASPVGKTRQRHVRRGQHVGRAAGRDEHRPAPVAWDPGERRQRLGRHVVGGLAEHDDDARRRAGGVEGVGERRAPGHRLVDRRRAHDGDAARRAPGLAVDGCRRVGRGRRRVAEDRGGGGGEGDVVGDPRRRGRAPSTRWVPSWIAAAPRVGRPTATTGHPGDDGVSRRRPAGQVVGQIDRRCRRTARGQPWRRARTARRRRRRRIRSCGGSGHRPS